MTGRHRGRRDAAGASAGVAPQRTCVGCRQVRPQRILLRLVRLADGFVEPDPGGRGGGRGAYLCRGESCLTEAFRRGRWNQAFRAPAVLRTETFDRIRALLTVRREADPVGASRRDGGMDAPVTGAAGQPVEGRR
ncbi:MAG: YlxR family protein [Candidatus Rokuibacteriota bacterium]